jgi:flagellin-like protein
MDALMWRAAVRRVRNEDAVSPVVGTILMIAVTVALAAVLWVIVSSMMDPGEDPQDNVVMLQQERVTQPDATHYDTSYSVIVVRSENKYMIADLSFAIQGSHGSLLTDATFSFNDADGNGYVSEGDIFQVQGMHEDYKAGMVKLFSRGTLIGQQSIAW